MNITVYSNNRLRETASQWEVPQDFANPMLNYLVYGYKPGSCFTAVLANDFVGAMSRSHPANTVQAMKSLVGWIQDYMPAGAWGNYDAVKSWAALDESFRRQILEEHNLIYSEREETWLVLNHA